MPLSPIRTPVPSRAAPGRNAFRQNTSGVAAIEFAIVCPVLLMLLAGITIYGLYFVTANSVQQLAADAARVSVAGITPEERISLARKHVSDRSKDYLLLSHKNISVSAAPTPDDVNQFGITVRYDASALPLNVFGSFFNAPDAVIVRSASIRRGGF